jgi:hypothetical protein
LAKEILLIESGMNSITLLKALTESLYGNWPTVWTMGRLERWLSWVVLVLGEQAARLGVNSFVIGQDYKVGLRSQPHLRLPIRGRQNRDVLAMMTPLKPAKSFICRLGFMEFLFTRDKIVRGYRHALILNKNPHLWMDST